MRDKFFDDVQAVVIDATEAFYEWEQGRYNGNSPLSDDDRIVWMQGYVYAQTRKDVK
jgi:hypothetical protein